MKIRTGLLLILLLSAVCMHGQTNCPMPQGVSIGTLRADKITLIWNSQTLQDGPIRVAYAAAPGNNFIYKEFNTGTEGTLTGLKPGVSYMIRVDRVCSGNIYTPALHLGTTRTLTAAEETLLCVPEVTGDLCEVLKHTKISNQGTNFIEIVVPQLPQEILAKYEQHAIISACRPTTPSGAAWTYQTLYYSALDHGVFRLNNLIPNTLYEIKISWTSTGSSVDARTCTINLNNTPTIGPQFIGPTFAQLPPDITLDCASKTPYPIETPAVTGGCSTPKVTYTDVEQGSGCTRSIIRTWLTVDNCGRSNTVTQNILFKDQQPPRFVDLPVNNGIIECGDNLPTEAPTAVDNCSSVTIQYQVSEQPQTTGCAKTVTRIWTASDLCGNSVTYTQTITVRNPTEETNGEDPKVPPLPVNCGQAYPQPAVTNQNPMLSAVAGQVFNISGFPLRLENVSGSGGVFSGKGKVRLPFGNKVVYTEFSNIRVNTSGTILEGTLIAKADPNFVMPTGDYFDIGGEICIPEPAISEAGFNNNGDYIREPPYESWTPGDPIDPKYDPNGFDVNGYHRDTGEPYNEQGCGQNNIDRNGDPCNAGTKGPYYWLHNNNANTTLGPTTPEGIALATALQTGGIREKIEAGINTLLQQNETAVTAKRAQCTPIKAELETKATGLDPKYLFGAANEYLNEGMFLQFRSAPVPLQVNVPERTKQIEDVEKKHIELYYCDKLLYKLKQIDLILKEFKTPYDLDQLVNGALEAIKRLPAAKAAEIKGSNAKLTEWILDFLNQELQKKLRDRGLAAVEQPAMPDYMQPTLPPEPTETRQNHHPWRFLASNDDASTHEALLQMLGAPSEDELAFAFRQGMEYVGNTHRAFYLDAIARARDVRGESVTGDGEDPESLLPIRLEKTAGGRTYTILLDKITFTPQGATLDAYMILSIPNTNQKVVFRAKNVPFMPGGMSGDGIQLSLESDIGIRLNNTAKLYLRGSNGKTFVKWDCTGFAGMSVDAEIEFCRNYFTPLTPALEVDTNSATRVKAYFTASMPAWGEFIANLSIDPFALTKHPDYKWQIQNAWIDFSDLENPTNFTNITPNYVSEFSTPSGGGFSKQWKGFFLEALTVTMPKKFQKEGTAPIKITAEKLIIDDRGLTGLLTVQGNLISLNDGNLSGWAFSMDQFRLAVVTNRIRGGGFGGLIHVPIFGAPGNTGAPTPADCFRYSASIIATKDAELYEFSVKPAAGALAVDIWAGTATLDSNSYLRVKSDQTGFIIEASLSGKMQVDGDLGDNIALKIPPLTFQNLRLSNKAPYISGCSFGVPIALGAKIGGFSLTISGPAMRPGDGSNCTLAVGAMLKLVGGDAEDGKHGLNIAAATSVLLHGEMVNTNGRQRWKYKDFGIEKIALNAKWKGVNAIQGSLEWYKTDPVYGRGFRGAVTVEFSGLKKLGDIGIAAIAQFGSVNEYKYFMVDALVSLGQGIALGGVSLKAFGGGAYYHMSRDSSFFLGLGGNGNTASSSLGVSMSGIKYTPSRSIGLGLKAMVVLATTLDEDLFNAAVTFEVRFNSKDSSGTGGIKDIALYGNARVMAKLEFSTYTGAPSAAAPISAKASITYDFTNKTLHGDLEVYANVNGVFVGTGSGDLLGNAAIHFDKDKWYIHIGTPSRRLGIGLNIPIGNTSVNLITAQAYLCIGTGGVPMPDLPPYVREMTGLDNFMASENSRASGRGFAFGASLKIGTPKLQFLIFYAKLEAGLGFDVMLQKYSGFTCANNGGRPIGINGWYASGQAWAYIDADIGLAFRGKNFSILKVGAAAALQMKLPNPFWARGAVSGRYRILGGLIKGDCNFKFTIGQNCESSDGNDETQYLKLIEALTPGDKADNVELPTQPAAVFGIPVNSSFPMYDNAGNETTYTSNLTKVKLLKEDGTEVPGTTIFSADKRTMTFDTRNFLISNSKYTFEATVECYQNGTVVRTENKIVEFTTGRAPGVIPKTNISAAYPMDGMYNLYRYETTEAYIRLKTGQPEVLTDEDNGIRVRFTAKGQSPVEVRATVSDGYTLITFPLPSDRLQPNLTYRMDVIKGVSNNSGNSAFTTTADGSSQETIIHQLFFRVSVFGKFADKILQFQAQSTASDNYYTLMRSGDLEPFDQIELQGSASLPPLVKIQAGSSDYWDAVLMIYKELETAQFRPNNRAVGTNQSLISERVIEFVVADSSSGTYRANSDLFNTNPAGNPAKPLKLVHILYQTALSDFNVFTYQTHQTVAEECSSCNDSGNLPNQYCEPGISDRCCCSQTLKDVYNSPALWNIFTNNLPILPPGSTHPVHFSYSLPGGPTTTPGVRFYFTKL